MFNNKALLRKRKAFTLIELLIVIAIIGILFIVLVSKVDFATDKAKATGVQTDFRSFQIAVETVAREKGGFNKFGWDTGDLNADHIRNSYDTGDANQDGVKQDNEIWIGHKEYAETWTGVYTLIKPGTNVLDEAALIELEAAINANLDSKLHIRINADGTIIMANGATDPWGCEYTGRYLSNAVIDELDSGAIVFYSSGPNKVLNINTNVANGEAINFNKNGDVTGTDDLAIAVIYTYTNGYGEVKTTTDGFSNNIRPNNSAPGNNVETVDPGEVEFEELTPGLYKTDSNWGKILYTWDDLIELGVITSKGAVVDGMQDFLEGDLVIGNINTFQYCAFKNCKNITGVYIPSTVRYTGSSGMSGEAFGPFSYCTGLKFVKFDENCTMSSTAIAMFYGCTNLTEIHLPKTLTSIGYASFGGCTNLKNFYYYGDVEDWCKISFGEYGLSLSADAKVYFNGKLVKDIVIPESITKIGNSQFCNFRWVESITLHDGITSIGDHAFRGTNIKTMYIPDGITQIPYGCFKECKSLKSLSLPASVTKTGSVVAGYVFEGCSLDTVEFRGTFEQWINVEHRDSYSNPATFAETFITIDGIPTEYVIPSYMTKVPYMSFAGIKGLNKVVFHEGITHIQWNAFYKCSNLTDVVLGNNITRIESSAFNETNVQYNIYNNGKYLGTKDNPYYALCGLVDKNAKEIVMHPNTIMIRDYAFEYTWSCKSIEFSNNLKYIGSYALQYCGVTTITIPTSVQIIYSSALYTSYLKEIIYNGTVTEWNNITKDSRILYESNKPEIQCTDGNVVQQ